MSEAPDEYVTIRARARAETNVRGSRFIAQAFPVRVKEEIDRALESVRREYHDATHHCFAYRLGTPPGKSRAVDAGEPSGTAGRPILAAIERKGVSDVLVVVTRYFGGTKLGVGNLIRAYGGAAERALVSTESLARLVVESVAISFGHAHINAVRHVIALKGAQVTETRYDDDVHMMLEIRLSRAAELKDSLRERTRGAVRFTTQ